MQMYRQTLQQYAGRVLPQWHPNSRMVRRVLDRLIPQSGVQDSAWEVHVINDPQKNAFVMPGFVTRLGELRDRADLRVAEERYLCSAGYCPFVEERTGLRQCWDTRLRTMLRITRRRG